MAVAPKQSGLNILRRLIPLNTLSEDALQSLMDKAVFDKLKKGEHLFEKGDTDPFNIYLLSGRVSMMSGSREMDSVDAGSDTARFPIAHQIPRKFTGVASTKCEIVRIDNRIIGELLAQAGNTTYEVSEFEEEETDDWMSQLLNSRVFQQIPASNIQSVMMRMQEQEVVAGDVIINIGDEGDFFYLINKGRCSVQRPANDDSDEVVELAQLGPGESFGEEALLSDKPRSSTVVMLTDGMLLRLSKEDFIQFVKHPLAHMVNAQQVQEQVQQGTVLLDVRSTEEYDAKHLPGSLSLPLNSLRYQASSLDPEQSYIVYCNDGQQSSTAAYLLIEHGFNVSVLEGGMKQAAGLLEDDQPQRPENVVELHPEESHQAADSSGSARSPEDAKSIAFLKQELSNAQSQLREHQQSINNFKLAFDEAKDQLEQHEKAEQQANQKAKELEGKLEQQQQAEQEARQKADLLDEQLDQLKGELSEKAQALEEMRALGQRADESAAHAEELSRNLADAQTLIDQLKAENSMLEQQATQDEETLNDKESTLAALMSELGGFKQDVERLQTELQGQEGEQQQILSERERQLTELRQQLNDVLQERSDLQEQLAATEQNHLTLQQAQSESEASFAGLQEKLQQTESEYEQASSALSQAQDEIESLKQAAESASTRADEVQQRLANMEAEHGHATDDYQKQLNDLQHAANERDALQVQLAELQPVVDERDSLNARVAELESITAERDSLRTQLDELQPVVEERDSLQARLAELDQATAERDGLQKQLDELAAVVEERDGLLAKLEDLQRLADEHEQLQQQLSESSEASSERDTYAARVSELEQERDRLASQLEEVQSQAKADAEQLEAKLADTEQSSQDLQRELEALQQSLQGAKDDEATAQARVVELEQALSQQSVETSTQDEQQAQLEADLARLTSELEVEQQQRIQIEQELASRAELSPEEIETLKQELEAADTGRQQAEDALEKLKQSSRAAEGDNQDVAALTAELDTLNSALDESDKAYTTLDEQYKSACDERDQASSQVDRLKSEVEELRSIMQDYVDQANSSGEDAAEDVAALKAELALVREQADSEVAQLKESLEQAQADLKAHELSGSVDTSENQTLKDEMTELQRSLSEREADVERVVRDQHNLQSLVEERNSEIERLKHTLDIAQDEAEEAQFNRDEALEAKKLVDDALYKLQQDLEKEQRSQHMVDSRLASSAAPKALDFSAIAGGGSLFKGLLFGALLAFGGAEALSVMSGKGELISGFLNPSAEVVVPSTPASDIPVPDKKKMASDTGNTAVDSLQMDQAQPGVSADSDKMRGVFVESSSVDEVKQTTINVVAADSTVEDITASPVSEPEKANEAIEPITPSASLPEPVPAPVEIKKPVPTGPETGTSLRDRLASGGFAPEMVYIRGAEFTMGSDRSQLEPEERPAHQVKLGNFAIGRYEVTFDDYQRFADATGRVVPDDLGWGSGRRPVINISWEDATAYADWLSRETGHRYRLPTEAEWEYAAAGGSEGYFWWGYEIENGRANCFNCGSQWDGASTAPVGSFEPNGYGLHNTAGNVLEWVQDCYHPSYDGAPDDGSAWVEEECRERAIRGGAFNKPGDSMRTTYRSRHDYDARLFILGFRVARDVR